MSSLYLLPVAFCLFVASVPDSEGALTISRKELPNGLKVIVVENHERPLVTINCAIKSGAAEELSVKAGLAHLTAKMLLQGTQSKTAAEIAESLDCLGASISVSADWDMTTIKITILKRVLPQALALLAEALQHPSFPAWEIDKVKSGAAGESSNSDNLWQTADLAFNRALFAEHRYGMPLRGNEKTLAGIMREDLFDFYHDHYAPNNTVIVFSGDVTLREIEPMIAREMGKWKERNVRRPYAISSVAIEGARVVVVDRPAATQAQIRLGFPATGRSATDITAIRMVNSILSDRLSKELRARRTITYGVSSNYDLRKIPGPFMIWTFTRPAQASEAIETILSVAAQLAEQGPTREEFDRMKERFKVGSWALLELPDLLAARIIEAEVYGDRIESVEAIERGIDAVTFDLVKQTARKYFKEPGAPNSQREWTIVVAGPASVLAESMKRFGPVKVIP